MMKKRKETLKKLLKNKDNSWNVRKAGLATIKNLGNSLNKDFSKKDDEVEKT